ncbi:DUF6493 family protein [Streptomyces sp. NPDC048057]|uniref:DUF7824 domain-containing protein n=1 Tax=Streptomyces sp. NPDC048057 TaxID=3155628 RepID=UPI0033C7963B
MNEVMDAVRGHQLQELVKRLAPLTPAERKELLHELKSLRNEQRNSDWEDWEAWKKRGKISMALLVAGAACHTGAAAAAAWIGARDLRLPRGPAQMPVLPPLVQVLSERDPAWLADLAHRLAARTSTGEEDYALIRELVDVAGCPVPTSDGYVRGWARHLTERRLLMRGILQEPQVSTLVGRLFELPEIPVDVLDFAEPDKPHHWPQALARLAECGAMARPELVDHCVARLLRGGRPQDLRFALAVLKQLALTPEEEAARIPDWMGMAADGVPQVAAHAQGVLGRLALDGRLPDATLAEACESVFFRPEKKLVRDQLILLGKVLTARARAKDQDAVGTLLHSVGGAFGHADAAAQERALKLVARHLPAVDTATRLALAESALLLGTVHRRTAAELLGTPLADESTAYEAETLPAAPVRRRAQAPASSVPELISELVAAVATQPTAVAFERALDGLVRLAYQDRQPLVTAVRESFEDAWWFSNPGHGNPLPYGVTGLREVLAAGVGTIALETVRKVHAQSTASDVCPVNGMGAVLRGRLAEVAWRLRTDPLPLLLATPTWETGALDAEVLVERLREYQRLGVRPEPVDFTQALLRVAPASGGPAAQEAALLGTDEGDRLATWLDDTWPELVALQRPEGDPDGAKKPREPVWPDGQPPTSTLLEQTARGARALADRTRDLLKARRLLPSHARWLSRPVDTGHLHSYRCPDGQHDFTQLTPGWVATLPHHRDAVAAWVLALLDHLCTRGAGRWEWRGLMGSLPLLAEGEGEGVAGPPLHRAVVTALGAPDQEVRLAAVDTLLTLAARRQLDPELLGRLVGERVVSGELKPNRLADAARTAAATGAHETTWAVLAAALPALLPARPPVRALGELLEVAADCAERCAPSRGEGDGAEPGAADRTAQKDAQKDGDLATGLADVAAQGGSSARVTQAARLLAAVRQLAG